MDEIREQWARERPELDTEAMGILGRIYRIAATAHQAMDRACARYGISRADYDVLATLRRSGEPFQLAPGALTRSLMLTSGGMTGRLDRLEAAGLVIRIAGTGDRRSLLVALTDHGRQVIDEAVDAGVETQQLLLAKLPPDRRRQLDELLRDLLTAVTTNAPPPRTSKRGAVAASRPAGRSGT